MKKEDRQFLWCVISVIMASIIIVVASLSVSKDKYFYIHAINNSTCCRVKSNKFKEQEHYYKIWLENGSHVYLEKEKYYYTYGKSCPFCNE